MGARASQRSRQQLVIWLTVALAVTTVVGGGALSTAKAANAQVPLVQQAVLSEDLGYLNLSQRGGRPVGPGVDGDGPPPLQPASMSAAFSNFELNGIPFAAWQTCRATGTVDDCLESLVADRDGDGAKGLRDLHPGAIGGDTLSFDVTITNTSPDAVLTAFAWQSKFSESPALASRIGDKLFSAELDPAASGPGGMLGVKKNGVANGLLGGKVKSICIDSSTDYLSELNLGTENETLECAGGRILDESFQPVLESSDGDIITEDNVELPKGMQPGESQTLRIVLDAGTDDGALQRAHGASGPDGLVGPLVGTLANAGEFRAPELAAECLELGVQPGDNVLDVVNFGDVKIIRDAAGSCTPSFDPFSENQFLTVPRRNWGFTDVLDTRDDFLPEELPTVLTGGTGVFSMLDFDNLRDGELNLFEIMRGFGEHGETLDPSCADGASRAGSCGGEAYVPHAEFYAVADGQLVRQEVGGTYDPADYSSDPDAPSLTASIDTGGQTSCTGPGLTVRCKTTDPFEPPGQPNPGPTIGASATATFTDVQVIADDKTTTTNEGGRAGGNKVQVTVNITNTSPADSGIHLTSFNWQSKERGLTDINDRLDGTSILGRQDLRLGADGTLEVCGDDPRQVRCFDEDLGIGRFPNVLGNSLLSATPIAGLEAGKLESVKKNGTFMPLTKGDARAANFICIKSGAPAADQDADETCFGQPGQGLGPGESQSVTLELDYGDFRGLILRVAPGTLVPQLAPFGLLALGGDFDCRDQRRLPYCHPDLVGSDWFTSPTALQDIEFVTVHQPGDAPSVMSFEQNFGALLAMGGFAPTAEFYQGDTQVQVQGTYCSLPGGVTAPLDACGATPDPDVNQAPTAAFTHTCDPQAADGTVTCTLDATSSSDPDGTITGWGWDIVGSEGTDPYTATGIGQVVAHTFPEPGLYSVTLTVTDDDGGTGTAVASVTAEAGDTDRPPGEPPTADFSYECALADPAVDPQPDLICDFDGATSTAGSEPITSYGWSFYRTEKSPSSADPELLDSDQGIGIPYTFADVNDVAYTYTATLTVTDDAGLSDTASEDIPVPAPEPEPEPDGLELQVTTEKVRGINVARLSWTGGSAPYDVLRNGGTLASGLSGTAHIDNTGTRGRQTFSYQVCDADSCSDPVTVTFS